MRELGYSAEQIADAAACGYNPWEFVPAHERAVLGACENSDPELAMIFDNLLESAALYHALTWRYLQVWGELGELYAEIKYGIVRHKPHTQGSDGKLGNDLVEIKTISPEKGEGAVQVKRAGDFSLLLVVRINEHFEFEGRFLRRKQLSEGESTHARVSWSKLPTDDREL